MDTIKSKIAIDAATPTQMAEFAQDAYDLDVTYRTGKVRILEKLREAGFEGDEITATSSAPVLADKDGIAARAMAAGEEMVTVNIGTRDGPGGDRAVPLGCNGSVMLVPRDRDCKIPRRFYESLKNAEELSYEQKVDERGNPEGLTEGRKVKSYPHSAILGG